MDVISKTIATIEDSGEADKFGPNGGFTAVLSTSSLDRDGDILNRSEWLEPLPLRLPLDADHGMTVADTIGSFVPYFDDAGRLMMDATFASTAKGQEVRTLIKEGHISTVSVAFLNDKTAQKDGKPHRELLNAGVVAIPSNRDAVILDSKALDKRIAELAIEKLHVKAPGDAPTGNDNALLQAIHDASVHLGAQCAECTEPHAADMPTPPPGAPPAAAPAAAPKKALELPDIIITNKSETVDITCGDEAKSFTWEEFSNGTAEVWIKSVTEDLPKEEETPKFTTEDILSAILAQSGKSITIEQFNTALDTITSDVKDAGTPKAEADSPAEEEPAPDVKSAAASDDAADDADESAGEVEKRALLMEMELFASEF